MVQQKKWYMWTNVYLPKRRTLSKYPGSQKLLEKHSTLFWTLLIPSQKLIMQSFKLKKKKIQKRKHFQLCWVEHLSVQSPPLQWLRTGSRKLQKNTKLQVSLIQQLAMLLISFVSLDLSLNLLLPQFPHYRIKIGTDNLYTFFSILKWTSPLSSKFYQLIYLLFPFALSTVDTANSCFLIRLQQLFKYILEDSYECPLHSLPSDLNQSPR